MNHKIELYDFQQEVLTDPARFKVMASGRRVGKSYLACVAAYQHCLEAPERRALIIGPTVSMIRESIWQTLKKNNMQSDTHIRLIVSRGIKSTPYQHPKVTVGKPTVVIIPEYKKPNREVFDNGIKLASVNTKRDSPTPKN